MANSTSPFRNYSEEAVQRSLAETSTHAVVLSLICLTSVIGNGLVAAIIYLDRHLHNPTFYFIASLSLADIIVGAVYIPFFAVSVIKQEWQYSTAWCKGHAATISLSFNASLVTLCFVSLDRFLAITKPLRYQSLLTSYRASMMIAVGWLHSIFWAVTPLVGWGEIAFDPKTNICRPNWAATGLPSKIYAMLLALVAFAVPSVAMIYCYCKIFRVARHQVKLIKQNSVSTSGSTTTAGQNNVKETRALKTILLVIGAFVVAWLPYTILSMGKLFSKGKLDVDVTGTNAVLTVTLLNGCINPVIYSLRDKRFKRGLKKLLCPCAAIKVTKRDEDFTSCAATRNLQQGTRNADEESDLANGKYRRKTSEL